MLAENIAENSIDVPVAVDFSFRSVSRCIGDMLNQSFDVFQESNPFDPEDGEVVPLVLVAVTKMPFNPAQKILREADVVEFLVMVKGVDAGLPPEEIPEALSKNVAGKDAARKPARHALDEGASCVFLSTS